MVFYEARSKYTAADNEAIFPPNANSEKSVHILWMYPDVLHMHGGRGNLMALAKYAMSMELPLTIKKCVYLDDYIDFDWADAMLFESGDLSVMRDVVSALRPKEDKIAGFAAGKRPILAIGSSGAIFCKETKLADGETISLQNY